MKNKNVLSIADYQIQKQELEQHTKYESLLGTLSLTEIRSEINDLVRELKTMIGLGKSEAAQGKMILKELEERCTQQQCSEQINMLLSQFEKQMATLER